MEAKKHKEYQKTVRIKILEAATQYPETYKYKLLLKSFDMEMSDAYSNYLQRTNQIIRKYDEILESKLKEK
tara:strand:- start:2344 stop:2556 length:213 start_codon:yes stop_codon:yes gene_type:complete